MYLMQTVSAVPRARTAAHMEAKPPYINPNPVNNTNHYRKSNDVGNHGTAYQPQYENGFRKVEQPRSRNTLETERIENEEEKDKKKDKKWTLGGLFRRKSRKEAYESSDESGDEGRKGFLSRRKLKSDRQKSRVKSSASGFDVVIPQQKDARLNGIGKSAEELWSGNTQVSRPKALDIPTGNNNHEPVRYIYRHQNGASPEAPKASPQSKHRRDSSLSRNSSGGSGSLDGRRGRKEVMARAEAKRDQMREESSSDENEYYNSNSSLNADGTHSSRRSRGSRVERHNSKRLSRDEQSMIMHKEGPDVRMVKSDFEGGRRLIPNCRWISKSYYPDSSDHEPGRFSLMTHSATSSPARSPRVRPRQLPQAPPVPLPSSYPMSTFPPGVHFPQGRVPVPNYPGVYPNPRFVHAKEVHGSQPMLNVNYRNPGPKPNRNSEYVQDMMRSNSEHSTTRKSLMDYEEFLIATGAGREKSLSYDQDIHRASYFENEPVQRPVTRTNSHSIQPTYRELTNCSESSAKPEPPPRDGRRISGINHYYDLPQHTLRAYGNENGMVANRINSMSSLPVQPGSYPHQSKEIVPRSSSGNSFCELYENEKDYYNQNRSSSYQHIPTYINQHPMYQNYGPAVPEPKKATVRYTQSGKPESVFYWSQDETVPARPTIIQSDAKDIIYTNIPPHYEPQPVLNRSPIPIPRPNNTITNLRYYADQNPRSRNPIHITCNATPNPSPTNVQAYHSDSQIVVKPEQQNSVKESVANASGFWRMKNQENLTNNGPKRRVLPSSFKPPLTQHSARSRSSSPMPMEMVKFPVAPKHKDATLPAENNVQKPHWTLFKDVNIHVTRVNPPDPPARRYSRQDFSAKSGNKNDENKPNNFDDAVNELESIYKSLQLGDEDLLERAERRDLPVFRGSQNKRECTPSAVRNRVGESKTFAENEVQRAVPQRKAGVPDKVSDDMAFRRLNVKDRTDAKKFLPQGYLRSSPVPGGRPIVRKESPVQEPDVTYDDVVFRNIRHANSTLKVADPQPPFGIPIGPITPAPNSDYLHATPKDRFRPSFTSSKCPDLVKDDLAFRNLRKDNQTANLPAAENATSSTNELFTNPNFILQKKRAVRSLSANLQTVMQQENSAFAPIESMKNHGLDKECERTQSLTDLAESGNSLEKRLKQLKDEKNSKRAEFFELSKEQKLKKLEKGAKFKLSLNELANLSGDLENVPQINTSTETLTEEKESRKQKSRASLNSDDSVKPPPAPERKTFRSPVVELSKYPAAIPSSSLYSNPFRENSSSPDPSHIEHILSELAIETRNVSEDISRQLFELELATRPKSKSKRESPPKDDEPKTKSRSNSVEKSPRRRSLSRSDSQEKSPEKSPEKRREKRSRNNSLKNEERLLRKHSEQEIKIEDVKPVETETIAVSNPSPPVPVTVQNQPSPEMTKPEPGVPQNTPPNSYPKERKASANFVAEIDLPQILSDIQEQSTILEDDSLPKVTQTESQNCSNKDPFQEVYEYNCGLLDLNPPKRKKSHPGETIKVNEEILEILSSRGRSDPGFKSPVQTLEALMLDEDLTSEIDKEFEKLHDEVDAKETKESQICDDLLADVMSVATPSKESLSPRPFPNEPDEGLKSNGKVVSDRDGTSPGSSSSGEGETKKASLDSNLWLACSYALAFALHLQELDFLTALGIVLAVVSIIAILIL